ncbi:hypothetical protein FBQ82_04345 [Anaerolineae bacterium CFX7]|nr:hypothetical protein [Anaerolineae bacterium CFX7]RIK18144.1 MAG: hypothetical protein DCC52_16180 [Chloroflexota bacterium]
MKAYEFPTKISSEGTLEIPTPVKEILPRGEIVRVILLVQEPEDLYEQKQWATLTAKEFFAGYVESDSIYDETK